MAIDTELRQQINAQGYSVGDIETYGGIPRITLYKEVKVGKTKDGTTKTIWESMPNLPGDADSLKKYLRRGFKLSPPGEPKSSDHPLINPSFIKDATLDKNGNPII